jgi:cysteine synthase A
VGAVALVAGWAARSYPAGTRIAAVFPDGPHRYLDTVYNDGWCHGHGLLETAVPPEPEEIKEPGERAVTSWTRCTTVTDPAPAARTPLAGAR